MPPLNEERVREIMREEFSTFIRSDRFTFPKLIQMLDGRNIQTGRTTGTKFPQASDQKWGAFGVTPVDQPATVSDPSGGGTVDAEARTAIDTLIDRLKELGLIA